MAKHLTNSLQRVIRTKRAKKIKVRDRDAENLNVPYLEDIKFKIDRPYSSSKSCCFHVPTSVTQ